MDLSQSSAPAKIYIYHIDHEHDRTYAENVVNYLDGQGILSRAVMLNVDGPRPELQLCIDDNAAVLGFNSDLDHSWLPSGKFLDAAERHGIPVLQWILDHPSCRWPDFTVSTADNCRYLLNTDDQCDYFESYCLPGAVTARMGGIGPNWRSHVGALTQHTFMERPFSCMAPLSLHRLWSMEETDAALNATPRPLADIARTAIASAQGDLFGSLQSHVAAALAASSQYVLPQTFHLLCRLVEHSVQTFRRLKIFATANKYPVLIQSDGSATRFVNGGVATLATNVGMRLTLTRFPMCRAVLSVSPNSDMIHDRTMNALNAGCVAIAEDNLAVQGLLEHKVNALLFRYDDDSLDECLDIACHQPEFAYKIAQAGMQLRHDPRLGVGRFHNIIDLAQLRPCRTAAVG
jgi:hypothetical protein